MSINLTGYTNLRAATFVRIDIDQYRTTSSGSYSTQILRFSDHNATLLIDSESYVPLGRLMGVSSTTSELRSSNNDIVISLGGVPDASLAEVVHSRIKGSSVKVYRAYFTQAGTQIGATQGRWLGNINNYNLDEEYDILTGNATNTIQFNCVSSIDMLQRKLAGLKTNPNSIKQYSATDTSFDRVPSLIGSQFDFGVQR
jgi:hypothetical protein